MITAELIRPIIKPRDNYSHKGDYGHCALIAGSKGMMGAAVLAARSCIRSGAGKLTCHIPETGYTIMQVSVPEAMCMVEKGKKHIRSVVSLKNYDAVGIGPGWGNYSSNVDLLKDIFGQFKKPMVIDADALNTLSHNKELLKELPAGSILTPHAKEFGRLFGEVADEEKRKALAIAKAKELNTIIVLKGYRTFIAIPSGKSYTNSTGNPGMATGGTGDVLTGILTALLGQGYSPEHAAIAGVYLHGLAGDLAAAEVSQSSLTASDIICYLGKAFLSLPSNSH